MPQIAHVAAQNTFIWITHHLASIKGTRNLGCTNVVCFREHSIENRWLSPMQLTSASQYWNVCFCFSSGSQKFTFHPATHRHLEYSFLFLGSSLKNNGLNQRFCLKGQGTSLPPSPCTMGRSLLGWWPAGGGIYGGGGKPKVSLLVKPLELQHYGTSRLFQSSKVKRFWMNERQKTTSPHLALTLTRNNAIHWFPTFLCAKTTF